MSPRSGDHTFPPSLRLRKRREFLRIQNHGRRFRSRRFLYSSKPSFTGRVRLGVTVSKKVGNSVCRNRIKRWVREVFRQHKHLIEQPVDLVVIAKRGVTDFSYQVIREELIDVFTCQLRKP